MTLRDRLTHLTLVVLCLVAGSLANSPGQQARAHHRHVRTRRDVDTGPLNAAVLAGSDIIMNCSGVPASNYRIQWYDPLGRQMTDGDMVLPGHPNAGRLQIVDDGNADTFDLRIQSTVTDDAGLYRCRDINVEQSRYADLVVMVDYPNCTNTLPENGVVNAGVYYTMECGVHFAAREPIAPYMDWTGYGTYNEHYTKTNVSAWGGVSFNAQKEMDGRSFRCVTNFTADGFGGTDTATNVPNWFHTYNSQLLFVQFPPENMRYEPIKETYDIGDVLTGYADASPLPTYKWTDMTTLIEYNSQSLTLTSEMATGQRLFRLHASNSVGTADIPVNITILPPTTTTTPPTTTTTTPWPAVSTCADVTGRWEAERSPTSKIVLCLNVDQNENGLIRGLLQNDTGDPFFIETIGKTNLPDNNKIGFSCIWPDGDAVTACAAECHRCYGTETMFVNLISRTSTESNFCSGGSYEAGATYTAYRVPTTFPCSDNLAQMQANFAIMDKQRRSIH